VNKEPVGKVSRIEINVRDSPRIAAYKAVGELLITLDQTPCLIPVSVALEGEEISSGKKMIKDHFCLLTDRQP
jgi:hypothetical protein